MNLPTSWSKKAVYTRENEADDLKPWLADLEIFNDNGNKVVSLSWGLGMGGVCNKPLLYKFEDTNMSAFRKHIDCLKDKKAEIIEIHDYKKSSLFGVELRIIKDVNGQYKILAQQIFNDSGFDYDPQFPSMIGMSLVPESILKDYGVSDYLPSLEIKLETQNEEDINQLLNVFHTIYLISE